MSGRVSARWNRHSPVRSLAQTRRVRWARGGWQFERGRTRRSSGRDWRVLATRVAVGVIALRDFSRWRPESCVLKLFLGQCHRANYTAAGGVVGGAQNLFSHARPQRPKRSWRRAKRRGTSVASEANLSGEPADVEYFRLRGNGGAHVRGRGNDVQDDVALGIVERRKFGFAVGVVERATRAGSVRRRCAHAYQVRIWRGWFPAWRSRKQGSRLRCHCARFLPRSCKRAATMMQRRRSGSPTASADLSETFRGNCGSVGGNGVGVGRERFGGAANANTVAALAFASSQSQ